MSRSTFPGTPLLTRSGTASAIGTAFDNFGADFTAFDGSLWAPGKAATWNASGGSTDNSWQVTLATTNVSGLSIRFKYRLNGVKSGGALVTGMDAFEYRIGTGAFQPVPGASLALVNNTSYSNEWSADLSALAAIENQGSVTLRWSLPDFDAVSATQLRVDDLQITGTGTAPPASPRTRYLPTGNYNVLFIAFDDLKANFGPFMTPELAAAMPKPVTPNLDRLSSSGMPFTRAYCQQAVCWASRASLMTGCRPDKTKIWDDGPNFRDTMPGVITLPQHFANSGFNVAGYGKIFDPRSTPPNQDAALSWPGGFSDPGISHNNSGSAHNFYEDGHWQAEQAAATGSGNRQSLFATDAGVTNFWVSPSRPVNPDTDYGDGLIATAAINKLNSFAGSYLGGGTPFFLAVGFKKPHLPFQAPKTFWDLYDPAQIDLDGYDGTRTMPTGSLNFTAATFEVGSYKDLNGANPVTPADARRLIHGYLAATSFADYQLGRVMAALDAAGVADNTIVVVWGDHGWHLGDHNGFWAKHSCYEQAARSPLIVRAPGMAELGTAGRACEAPVEFVDIFPTLTDLAGLSAPNQPSGFEFEGSSFLPLLEDPAQPWKKASFTQYQRNINGAGIANPGNGMGYSVRTARYRYTEWWRTQTSNQSGGGFTDRDVKLFSSPEFVELYDYRKDPNETVNLAKDPAHAALVAELSALLAGGEGWTTASVGAPAEYPVSYAAWREAHGTPGIDTVMDLAPLADPDGDSLWNLLEYKMGRHPLLPDPRDLVSRIVRDGENDFLSLEYDSVPSRSDVSLEAERSGSLQPGSFTTGGIETVVLSTDAGKEHKNSRAPVVPGSADFIRLRAE